MALKRLTLSVTVTPEGVARLRVERFVFPSPGRPEWLDGLVVPATRTMDDLDPLEVLERAVRLLQGQGEYLP